MIQGVPRNTPLREGRGLMVKAAGLCCAVILLSALAVLCWPLDCLEVSLAPLRGKSGQVVSDSNPDPAKSGPSVKSGPDTKSGPGIKSEPDSKAGRAVFFAPAPLGQEFHTRMLHSVQLTPVENIYRVQEGRIWLWQEWGKSHNAGLPFARPDRGRFIYRDDWMIVQGGGLSRASLVYRAGTAKFGRNALRVPPGQWRELWREYPGRRLIFTVRPACLGSLLFSGPPLPP